MWSDADALAEVNNALIANFTGALKLSNLRPKRFLLQTGAKQYGFHIGPATTPSFETDPEIYAYRLSMEVSLVFSTRICELSRSMLPSFSRVDVSEPVSTSTADSWAKQTTRAMPPNA